METTVQHHPEDNAIILWIAALALTGLIGFGLGTSFDRETRPSYVVSIEPDAVSSPDWHGNVKRSQDY